METFPQLLAFSAGSICLGVTLTIALLSALIGRSGGATNGEGCFGHALVLIAFGAAVFFFVLAARPSM